MMLFKFDIVFSVCIKYNDINVVIFKFSPVGISLILVKTLGVVRKHCLMLTWYMFELIAPIREKERRK